MDRNIEVKVGGSHLTKDSRCAGVRGEANVTRLKITFDEGWDNYAKTVTFWDARGGNPVKVLLTTDLLENISRSTRIYLVPIPAEPMAITGELTFVIEGFKGEFVKDDSGKYIIQYADKNKRQRSISDKLKVEDSPIADDAGEPTPPTATPTEMLQAQIENIIGTIQNAVDAEDKAMSHASAAEYFGIEAFKSAENAEKSAEQARSSVGKTSYIGANGNWFAWDSEVGDWYDTMVKAQSGSTVYVGENPPEDAEVWVDPKGEGTKVPVDFIEFSNGMKIIKSTEIPTGLSLSCGGKESLIYDGESNVSMAECDIEGNSIPDTYAKKEEVQAPKEVIQFTQGIRFVVDEDGLWVIREGDGYTEKKLLYNSLLDLFQVDYANESTYTLQASEDEGGNNIVATYATKEEVGNEISSIRFDLHNDISIIAGTTDYIGDKVDIIQDDMDAILGRVDNTEEKVDIIAENVTSIEGRLDYESHFRGYVSTNAKLESLVSTPNDFAYSAESGTKWIFDGDVGEWIDSGVAVPDQLTPPSDTTPLMNGEASVGRETAYARGDHRHPTDNTRASVAELNKLKDEVDTKIQAYIDEAILGGAW